MLPLFCLRLALGLLAALLLLRPAQINPRFYRTHFLTVFGLTALALVLLLSTSREASVSWPLYIAIALAVVGSLSWSIEGAPGGMVLIVLTLGAVGASLLADRMHLPSQTPPIQQAEAWRLAGELGTSLLLGVATTAMLMGHSYLIAPAMSLTPLKTLLGALFVGLFLRAGLAGLSLWMWTEQVGRVSLTDVTLLWLPVRWLLGLIVPAVLGVMAWHTTRIRNTQSSTGILYIVVVFVFLGELTAQLLLNVTGFSL
jgi:hypothetical protein